MAIAAGIRQQIAGSSLIRKMFEEGERLKAIHGPDKVYDFSLGNPMNEPPLEFQRRLQQLAVSPEPGMHRYMSNAGYLETRKAVAAVLSELSGEVVGAEHVIMTVGASGAMNVALKTILDPGDEVIILAPFFVEYKFYVANHGGKITVVETGPDFQPDLQLLAAAMTPRTRAIIINSPNNPTGVVYGADVLERLNQLVEERSRQYGRAVYVISDEPYARIAFDGHPVPPVFRHIRNSIVATSHSKDLALPGERIGYLAANPKIDEVDLLVEGFTLCNRTLGFVNAPALMQRLVAGLQRETVDIAEYQRKRDLFYTGLTAAGYQLVKPQGAFYLFPQSLLADDMAFVEKAQEFNILVVPGQAFGRAGYFRIAFCVELELIERALPVFAELARACRR